MKKIVLLIVIFIVVVAVALVYFTYTKPAPKAASLLPESTLLFVETPNFPRARAQFESTEAYALLQEPEVREFLAVPCAALSSLLGLDNAGERSPSTMLRALQGEAFIALTRLGAVGAQSRLHFVLGADVKRKRLEATTILEHLEHRFTTANPGATVSRKKYLGLRYTQWQLPEGQQFCHALIGSLLVIATDEDDMRDIMTRFSGQAAPDSMSLAASAKFQSAVNRMPGRHALFVYLNVEQLLGMAGPLLAFAPQSAGVFQNVARIQAAASSVTFAEDFIQDVGVVAYSRGEKPPAPSGRKTLAFTSSETSFYSARSLDWAALYTEAMNTLAHSGNFTLSASAAQFDQTLRENGIQLREDLLAKLGPETATLATWREGAQWPDVAIVTEFHNSSEARQTLSAVLDALKQAALGRDEQPSWEESSFHGETLRTLRLGGTSIAPTYAAVDDFFILALTPDYARELIGQFKDRKPTLTRNPSFELMSTRLPKSASTLTYCDLRTVYRQLYALAHANVSASGTNQLAQLAKLPHAETIEKHLAPYLSATVATEKNVTTVTFSSLGKPLTLLVGIAGGLGAAQPLIARLPLELIPTLPIMSSDTPAPLPPRENRKATSRTPATE